ncbi:MAG: hypothetical protein WC525_00370 [Candidatus Thermoplasmatota archaeon]
MINCERCKEKVALSKLIIFRDEETGETKKYCQACADIVKKQQVEKKTMTGKKEKETKPTVDSPQDGEPESNPESELLTMAESATDDNEHLQLHQMITDIVPSDSISDKIYSYLGEEGLNVGKDEYCYIKMVGNHLEIGRAKIVLEE